MILVPVFVVFDFFQLHHECIKPGFTADNYSVGKPINFYLKRLVFQHNA